MSSFDTLQFGRSIVPVTTIWPEEISEGNPVITWKLKKPITNFYRMSLRAFDPQQKCFLKLLSRSSTETWRQCQSKPKRCSYEQKEDASYIGLCLVLAWVKGTSSDTIKRIKHYTVYIWPVADRRLARLTSAWAASCKRMFPLNMPERHPLQTWLQEASPLTETSGKNHCTRKACISKNLTTRT